MRGIFQGVYVREITKHLGGAPLSDSFDLITGTSTGAIIALGVALNIDANKMVQLFLKCGPDIFTPRWQWYLSFCKGPRYNIQSLRKALTTVFGTMKLGDCRKPIVITATTLNRFGCRKFSNMGSVNDKELSVVDVILASCAAPTYFSPAQPADEERTYVDGGMWANTPSMAGIMHAYHIEGIPFREMRLVSIGNGEFPAGAIAEEFRKRRLFNPRLISSLFDMMFSTQRHMIEEAVNTLIGARNSLQVDVQLEKFLRLDDVVSSSVKLPALAEEAARNTIEQLRKFLQSKDTDDPKDMLVEDIMRSLRRYGYLRSFPQQEQIIKTLSSGTYIRSQNFYELLQKGLMTVKNVFRFINDHPFRPFAELVSNSIVDSTKYFGINAIPDALYSKADVERRLKIIESGGKKIQYFLLPKRDVHLSILIFDKRAALIYPTPLNRDVCNFSEGLFVSAKDGVEECISIFDHVLRIAEAYMKSNKINPIDDLRKFTDYYVA